MTNLRKIGESGLRCSEELEDKDNSLYIKLSFKPWWFFTFAMCMLCVFIAFLLCMVCIYTMQRCLRRFLKAYCTMEIPCSMHWPKVIVQILNVILNTCREVEGVFLFKGLSLCIWAWFVLSICNLVLAMSFLSLVPLM